MQHIHSNATFMGTTCGEKIRFSVTLKLMSHVNESDLCDMSCSIKHHITCTLSLSLIITQSLDLSLYSLIWDFFGILRQLQI